jgi:hypothetical protein
MATKKKVEKVKKSKKVRPRKATIEVVATAMGYYGDQRRREGDVFRIPEDEKLSSWMVLKSEYDGEETDEEGEEDEGHSTGDEDKI